MKLTDTQLVLLSAASRREDGAIVLAPNLKAAQPAKLAASTCATNRSKKSRLAARSRCGAVTMTPDH